MKRKILILGASGQLGTSLFHLLNSNYIVLSTSRNTIHRHTKNPHFKRLNIISTDALKNVIFQFKPDIVINCAAYTNVDKCEIDKKHTHDVNVQAVNNLIKILPGDTHYIHISTDYVFSGDNGPYREEDSTHPVNYYGKSKLEAENIIRGSRLKWTIFRPNVIYSQYLHSNANFFAWVYKSLLKNKSISIVKDQISNPTFVEELSKAILQSIIMAYYGILHIGSDHYLSRYDFALEIAKIFNLDPHLILPIYTNELHSKNPNYKAKRPLHSGLITSKIEKELNLITPSLQYSLSSFKNNLMKL